MLKVRLKKKLKKIMKKNIINNKIISTKLCLTYMKKTKDNHKLIICFLKRNYILIIVEKRLPKILII